MTTNIRFNFFSSTFLAVSLSFYICVHVHVQCMNLLPGLCAAEYVNKKTDRKRLKRF